MKPRGLAELDELELVFKALAHAQRRQILVVLDARGGAMTSGEIAERFSCKWPTTSRHLRVLEEAGLVEVEQQGREWNYTLNSAKLARVAGGWIGAFKEK
ncbi:MAG: metalloregulator ArsR/SmtB family transcription factor [Alphaproteobacteria bacterium]